MWDYISDRVIACANYIIDNGSTVRATAAYFKISKSTVHKDVTERLRRIDPTLYTSVRKTLDKNLSERHIRGGNATRLRFKRLKNELATE